MNTRRLTSNKGITLVALIITIIVLLILAMVSISLVMNGGIIDKSKSAVDKYSEEEVAEQIKLAYQEYQMSQYTGNPLTLQQAMDNAFGAGVATVSGDATNGWTVTVGGKSYPLSANGTVGQGETVVSWTKNQDGSYTAGEATIHVGDYVNYDPTAGVTTGLTYKSETTKSGYESDQTFDASKYEAAGFGWRVLDVKDGKVRLISENYVGPGDYGTTNLTKYYLKGQTGYINGKNELNAISAIYGKGTGADSAKSITVDDINGVTGYNPETANFSQGNWGEYGNQVTYTFNSENSYTATRTNGANAEANTNNFSGSFTYFNNATRTFVPLTTGSTTVTSTAYSYNPTTLDTTANAPTRGVDAEGNYNTEYQMIFGEWKAVQNSKRQFTGSGTRPDYWLASEYAYADSNKVDWGLRRVYNGNVANCYLYDNVNNVYCGVRPVVSLKSSVNLKWNATAGEWQIQ